MRRYACTYALLSLLVCGAPTPIAGPAIRRVRRRASSLFPALAQPPVPSLQLDNLRPTRTCCSCACSSSPPRPRAVAISRAAPSSAVEERRGEGISAAQPKAKISTLEGLLPQHTVDNGICMPNPHAACSRPSVEDGVPSGARSHPKLLTCQPLPLRRRRLQRRRRVPLRRRQPPGQRGHFLLKQPNLGEGAARADRVGGVKTSTL